MWTGAVIMLVLSGLLMLVVAIAGLLWHTVTSAQPLVVEPDAELVAAITPPPSGGLRGGPALTTPSSYRKNPGPVATVAT